jgi:hypothetical protein
VVARDAPDGAGADVLTEALVALGVEADRVAEHALDPSFDTVVLRGNANWYPELLDRLVRLDPSQRPFVVVWHSEPLPLPMTARLRRRRLTLRERAKVVLRDSRATDPFTNAQRLRWLAGRGLPDALGVSSVGGLEYLAEVGIRATHVPLGYHARQGTDLGLERDIDVLFLGALDVPRRARLLRDLRRHGVDVTAAGGWSDPRCWGEERTRLLNRAKIVLNLSRYEGQFSGGRLLLGMANGAAVVSEPMYRPEPFVPGRHYVSTAVDEIPAAVARLLEEAKEREALAALGHEFVTTQLTLERSVARILELARG